MAVVFSSSFADPTFADWSFHAGGVVVRPGGCAGGNILTPCNSPTGGLRKDLTRTAAVTIRAWAAIYDRYNNGFFDGLSAESLIPAGVSAGSFWFGLNLDHWDDGKIHLTAPAGTFVGTVSGGATAIATSAAGAFPRDGLYHDLQLLLSLPTTKQLDYSVTVDGVVVISGSVATQPAAPLCGGGTAGPIGYCSHLHVGAPCPGACDTWVDDATFSRAFVQANKFGAPIDGIVTYAYVEIDNTAASIPLAACAGAATINAFTCQDLSVTCADDRGCVGVAYDSFLTTTGGVAPYAYTLPTGSLPTGLTLNGATGEITGTPTGAGIFSFTVHVVDAAGKPSITDPSCTIIVAPAVENQTCATARVIDVSGGFPVTVTEDIRCSVTSGATPAPTCAVDPDPTTRNNPVWFKFTPPTDGFYTFDISGSDFQALLSIWCPTCSPATQFLCADARGPIATNTDCSLGYALDYLPYEDRTNILASPSDPNIPSCGGGSSPNAAWWTLTVPAGITPGTVLTIETTGSTFDTVLSAWTGACGALVEVACNDDYGPLQSKITLAVNPGEVYHLLVSSYDGANLGLGDVQMLVSYPGHPYPVTDVTVTGRFYGGQDYYLLATAPDDHSADLTPVLFEVVITQAGSAGPTSPCTPHGIPEHITLSPATATNPAGTTHTLLAVVTDHYHDPVAGAAVTLNCLSGPDMGLGLAVHATNGAGVATLSYLNNGSLGDDSLVATVVGGFSVVLTSAAVNKTWLRTDGNQAGDCDLPPSASTGGVGCAGDVASPAT